MVTILLVIIYASFISLGLPDSLFGVAWPVAHLDLGVDLSFASLLTIVVGACTSCMSMFSGRFIRKFGTGPVTAVSVLLTAIGLFGISVSPSVWWMIFCMIVLGIGAGAVDVGLNDYVSAHYKAQHMNWLHCFWGIGVTVSPLIMSEFLKNGAWRSGYRAVGFIQIGFTVLLFIALPLWKKVAAKNAATDAAEPVPEPEPGAKPMRLPGVKLAMAMLALYCGFEYILGTWGASFLIHTRGIEASVAAQWASMYYGGIMLGRFVSGFFSMKLSDKTLIRGGIAVMMLGALFLALPLGSGFALLGLLFIGVGCGPVFPCTIHATAGRFGKTYSADIVGFQMGGAYFGTLLIQPLFGYIASNTTFLITPYVLFGLAALQLVLMELLEAKLKKNRITAPAE